MKENNWYSVENKANEVDLFVYNEIGIDGVTAADFVKDLRATKGPVNLHINSPGGSPFDAVTMLTALKQRDVTVYVDGLAASAASVLAMAGKRRIMARHSMMMAHEAHGLEAGSADAMRKMADLLDLLSNNIAGIYAEAAGGTAEEWRARMATETWFSDQEAVDAGLATEIAADVLAPANEFDLSKFEHPPEQVIPEKHVDIDYRRLFEDATESVL
jgi:ATP-dependent protease ClpP protease subunit